MKRITAILLAFLMAAFFCLVFTGCRTTTEYSPDGGKTVIREADPLAIKLAGRAAAMALAYPVTRQK